MAEDEQPAETSEEPFPPDPTPESEPTPETPAEEAPAEPTPEPELDAPVERTTVEVPEADVQIRSAAKREIDMRIMPWGVVTNDRFGTEEFARGAFAGTDPTKVMLIGPEHERHLALGYNGEPDLVRRPVGRGLSLDERADGAYMTFKVARTASGDDVLALIEDGITPGVSIEFTELGGGTQARTRAGRRHRVQSRVQLNAVTTTYRPAYGERAAVLSVRSQDKEAHMGDQDQEAPVAGAEFSQETQNALLAQMSRAFDTPFSKIMDRLEKIEERARSESIAIPGVPESPAMTTGEWVSLALKAISGDRLGADQIRSLEQVRTLDDVVTSDNAGVVPPFFSTEVRGVIDPSRPFLGSTRRLETPAAGTQINVPIITQRPTTAKQSAEKAEVDSTKTIITSESFDMITIAGAGDLSIQVIKRSSPAFLNLWLELLAEAYAIDAEDQALRALFNAIGGGITGASALDPENLLLGAAYQTSFDAIRRPPNTIWLSTEAIAKFIDAKATTTNAPLYPGLTPSATAGGGITGTISGLNAVHVPSLDAHGAFAVVGPSSGFAWAEDGTYELQADVPSKAGRDVALVGMMWLVPWYPAAFTAYNVAS